MGVGGAYARIGLAFFAIVIGCTGAPGGPRDTGSGGGASGGASGDGSGGRASGTGGSSGSGGANGASGGSGPTATGGAAAATGGRSGAAGSSGSGGAPAGSGGAAVGTGGRTGNAGGSSGATGGAVGSSVPPGCTLPATVGFKADVRPFLITACGGGSGCHVIDAASTMASGGFDHAYDWITAGAHASSCPETPTPTRFDVVLAVIGAANPATCSKSRKMPPPDATGTELRAPLTACQVATLQAWLDEPRVTQMHRADDSSPTTPYAMPPYN